MSTVRVVLYNQTELEERDDLTLEAAIAMAKRPDIVGWIMLYGPEDADFSVLERELNLHPLALEDSRNQRQRPKVEEYPDHTYVVARSLLRDAEGELDSFQSNIFFSTVQNWVLVIHDRPIGLYDATRERIRRGRPRIRNSGSDFLVYALIDTAVDTYYPILQEISDAIDALEDEMFEDRTGGDVLDRIHHLRTDLRDVRRTVWPARDALAHLNREETRGFKKTTMPFLRDVQDHIARAIDLTESHREATSSLMDLYLNTVSNRLNEVMKVLTIVATIFIPLTFLAGVYGMNFDTDLPGNMPELTMPYAYVGFWVVAALMLAGEVWFFRRNGWI